MFIFSGVKTKEGEVGEGKFFKGLIPFDSFSRMVEGGHCL